MPRIAALMMTGTRIRQIITCLTATLLIGFIAFTITKSRALFSNYADPGAKSPDNPQLYLWAWERPTDLRFIDTRRVAVAFLAKSILLKSDDVLIRPRLQSLQLAEGAKVIPVTRIETDHDNRPNLSTKQRDVVVRAITDMASLPNVSAIQIDFDATKSERTFYRELITDLRQRLPANVHLSITALASWCMDDDWLSDLPIDEAVPMLFRMAGDGRNITNRLDAGDDFNAAPCRQSYGISLDEQRPKLLPSRKLFVFNPDAWTQQSVREISESNQ
jgi:hypothetical protein